MLIALIILLSAGKFNILSGQRFHNILQAEDTLAAIISSINLARDDSLKILLNQDFDDALHEALELPASDDHPFEALKTMVRLVSPDRKFRFFLWNLPTDDGRHRYFGYIKLLGLDPPLIYRLTDSSDSIPLPDTMQLDDRHWPGALYYQIIPGESANGQKIYTLLGWAGRNPLITRKLIEVLFFDDRDRPHFGMKLFPGYRDGNHTRVIFSYAATTTMSLKYEDQTFLTGRKWNSKKKAYEDSRHEARMIVFDRMVPLDPRLEGQYQYYVASGDSVDGFIFEHHVWKYLSGIESRNKK